MLVTLQNKFGADFYDISSADLDTRQSMKESSVQKQQLNALKEARMQAAIAGVMSGKYASAGEAAQKEQMSQKLFYGLQILDQIMQVSHCTLSH